MPAAAKSPGKEIIMATSVAQRTVRQQPVHAALTPEIATFSNLFVIAVSALAFLRLAERMEHGKTNAMDDKILKALRHSENLAIPIGPVWVPNVARDITALGSGVNLSIATAIVIGSLCLGRRYRAAGFLVLSLGSGTLLSRALKDFFFRERPTLVPRLTHFDQKSFPSGHSMLSALVYLTLGGIISRQTRERGAKTYFLAVAILLSLLVGTSRVYLGVQLSQRCFGRLGRRLALVNPVYSGCSLAATSRARRGAFDESRVCPSSPRHLTVARSSAGKTVSTPARPSARSNRLLVEPKRGLPPQAGR